MLNKTTEMRDRLLTARGETLLIASELLTKAESNFTKSALITILTNQSKIMGALEHLLKQNDPAR